MKMRFRNTLKLMLVLFGFVVVMPQVIGRAGASDIATGANAHVQILHSSETGITFRLLLPAPSQSADGALQAPGLDSRVTEPGMPALPYFTTYLALPPQATATVSVREVATTSMTLGRDVLPAPTVDAPDLDVLAPDTQLDEHLSYLPDPTVYGGDTLYPPEPVTLSDPMFARDLRLVELKLYPLRYQPAERTLLHSGELEVTVTFAGADFSDLHPIPAYQDVVVGALSGAVLNFAEAGAWRSRPAAPESTETVLPVGSDAYRIEVNKDGIYDLSYSELAVAGMNVAGIDPNTLEMSYRGQPVSYQFIGDSDDRFEPNESIRFYGWEFDGSRLERQFIPENRNYFWLWAGGTSSRIQEANNPTGNPVPDSFPESLTREEELLFQLTRTDGWDDFPNEPDAWYWTGMQKPAGTSDLTFGFSVNLPHPAAEGADAVLTAELLNRDDAEWSHSVQVYANDAPDYADGMQWSRRRNVNIVATTPITSVVAGDNTIHLLVKTADNTATATYYLNRITVEYPRQFVATGNQLQFSDVDGPHTFVVDGFTTGNPDNAVVWDITNQRRPRIIPMSAENIGGNSPYNWTFGSSREEGKYIATVPVNLLNPLAVSRYDVPDIDPGSAGADWVAIAHEDFIPAAEDLAAHRRLARFGGLKVHVVDYEDVINQYGYGFPVPAAIRDFLAYALSDWSPAPAYALLVGDASYNPRLLPCAETGFDADCVNWGIQQPHLVLTDLLFKDRYSGLVTSDFSLTLLDDDLFPELSIGRLPFETTGEAEAVVAKIIEFEQKHVSPSLWQRQILFVADAFDENAGDFCAENLAVSSLIPDKFKDIHLCLPDNPTIDDVNNLRAEMRELMVNHPDDGVTILNYRGHGSVTSWAKSFALLSSSDTNWWYPTIGEPNPVIITSMDCLDGNFAYPGARALSETFLSLDGAGSVAHWSSSGLGLTIEHTALAKGFYRGLFSEDLTAIGDAVNYAKVRYAQAGWHSSELYSFVLQGDPAMQIFRPDLALDKSSPQFSVEPGDDLAFTLTVKNEGLYASRPIVTDTLPAGLSYVSASSAAAMTTTISGDEITFEFLAPLARGESYTIDLITNLAPDFPGTSLLNTASVVAVGGLEGNLSNNSAVRSVLVGSTQELFLPLMLRP